MEKTAKRWILRAVCTATVRERWVLTSDEPITEQQAIDRLIEGEDEVDFEATLDCTDEEVENEEGRMVMEAFADDAPDVAGGSA